MRIIATKIVGQPDMRVLLATREGHVIFAQSNGLDADMNALIARVPRGVRRQGRRHARFRARERGQSGDVARLLDQAFARLVE